METAMNRPHRNGKLPTQKLPALLALGPVVVEQSVHLRRFRLQVRAYREGAKSLRKAHLLSCKQARTWGASEDLVGCWEKFRAAAFQVENWFSEYFGAPARLFIKLGEGMPWIGLDDEAAKADQLAEELLAWYDQSPPPDGAGPSPGAV